MLLPQEFAAAWGEDRYRFPPQILQDINIPEDAKTFLQEAGLPLPTQSLRGPYSVPMPLTPAFSPFHVTKYPLLAHYQSTQFRVLAYRQTGAALYCDEEYALYYAIEEGTGHIYAVGASLEIEPQLFVDARIFVNASLAQFAEFLLCYREFVAQFSPKEPERRRSEPPFRSLKQKWHEIDPVALADPDNYWVMAYYDIIECF